MEAQLLKLGDELQCPHCRRWHPVIQKYREGTRDVLRRVTVLKGSPCAATHSSINFSNSATVKVGSSEGAGIVQDSFNRPAISANTGWVNMML